MDTNSSKCLALATIVWMPHILVDENAKYPKIVGGTMLEVFEIFARHLNICYRHHMVKDQTAGYKLPNGSWTGAAGEVLRGEADMSGLGLAVTNDRFADFSFSEFLYQDEFTATYIRPTSEADFSGFIKGFTPLVWIWIIITTVAFTTAMFFVLLATEKIHEHRNVRPKKSNGALLEESWLWTLAPLLAQGVERKVTGESVRVITLLWLFVTFIVTTVYRSSLLSLLVLPTMRLPFNNLEELAESDLPVWMPAGSSVDIASKLAPKDSSLGRIQKNFKDSSGPPDVPAAVRTLAKGGHVLVAPRSAVLQITHGLFSKIGKCTTYVMAEGFMKTFLQSLLFRKGSPLKAKFDPMILRLREAGILSHVFNKGVINATECLKSIKTEETSQARALNLKDFLSTFIIYVGGIALAVPAFITEVLLHRFRRQRSTKRRPDFVATSGIK
ncbi:glutamate receptor-like [Macrobrachium rosenbergii]|uniref:glutamate receptor-like n=1 Tax=Macrobrachium rosenbergii TaxID=79674 RepID=UPI0034D7267E